MFQNLKDWQRAKEQITEMLAGWIVARDELDGMEMQPPEVEEDVESEQDQPQTPPAGGMQPSNIPQQITSEPKPHYGGKPASQRMPNQLQDGSATSAAPAAAGDASPAAASVYPPQSQRTKENSRERPLASGHRPYRQDCQVDRQSGKCYRRH